MTPTLIHFTVARDEEDVPVEKAAARDEDAGVEDAKMLVNKLLLELQLGKHPKGP